MSIGLRSTLTALRVTCLLCRAPLHDRRALCVLRDHDYLSVPRACLHACPNSFSTGRMVFFHVPAAHDDNQTVGRLWRVESFLREYIPTGRYRTRTGTSTLDTDATSIRDRRVCPRRDRERNRHRTRYHHYRKSSRHHIRRRRRENADIYIYLSATLTCPADDNKQ